VLLFVHKHYLGLLISSGKVQGLDMAENPYLRKVARVYQDSEVIFAEGSSGDEMYLVHSGVVKLVKKAPEGDIVIATTQTGEFFGEMALVDNAPPQCQRRRRRRPDQAPGPGPG
jgi:CRP-like cAMP-binding protein